MHGATLVNVAINGQPGETQDPRPISSIQIETCYHSQWESAQETLFKKGCKAKLLKNVQRVSSALTVLQHTFQYFSEHSTDFTS